MAACDYCANTPDQPIPGREMIACNTCGTPIYAPIYNMSTNQMEPYRKPVDTVPVDWAPLRCTFNKRTGKFKISRDRQFELTLGRAA